MIDQQSERYVLESLQVDHFGALHDRRIEGFAPGLNVVYGQNESGKTTLSAFIGGVLYGWDRSTTARNDYRGREGGRAGSLTFQAVGKAREQASDQGERITLSRSDHQEAAGDFALIRQVDYPTYSTVFSLDSDKLRGLKNSAGTTARLLAAGSGVGTAPAEALARIKRRIAQLVAPADAAAASKPADQAVEQGPSCNLLPPLTSAPSDPDSLPQLIAQRAAERERMRNLEEETQSLRQQDRELLQLKPERENMKQRVNEANARVEALAAAKRTVESLTQEEHRLRHQLESYRAEEAAAQSDLETTLAAMSRRLGALTQSEDRLLRSRLEEAAKRQERLDRSIDSARSNYTSSKAVYEALIETVDDEQDRREALSKRRLQVAFSTIVPIVLLLLGIPLFFEGYNHAMLTYLALGVALVLFACVMLAAGLVMVFRPTKEDVARKERFDDAHWVMVQDKKKLEACEQDKREFSDRLEAVLEEEGLQEAGGSLRQARLLLDDAKDVRAQAATHAQRKQAAALHATQVQKRLDEIADQLLVAWEKAGVPADARLSEIEAELAHRTQQRDDLVETLQEMNHRMGQVETLLAAGAAENEFDRSKLAVQMLTTRIEDAKVELARLLIAQRMLETTMATWESVRQPEVYARASELLKHMTSGAWCEVSLSSQGTPQVADATGRVCSAAHLSLGTCQQLYLALRVALLECAADVGRSIPVIADDILVHFDADRRAAAAEVLGDLARTRQIILFTCHAEVVEALRSADPSTRVIALEQ